MKCFRRSENGSLLVERSSGHKLKIFRTDNGGEFTSSEFEGYLRKEGIKHQYTIPKNTTTKWSIGTDESYSGGSCEIDAC